jgi:hypothetical protein
MTDRVKDFRPVFVLAALIALTGCARDRSEEKIEVAPNIPQPKYTSVELGELLRFAGKTAESAPADRLAECRQLLELNRTGPSPGVRLHLLLAQSATESCGTPREAATLADAALAGIGDERLKAFLIYHKVLLARLDREVGRRKALERQISQTVTKQQKTHRRLKSQESELKVLQQKLDALKAIEQSLDEPNDGQ